MISRLVITVPATDMSLLNVIEMRLAAGVDQDDDSQDALLSLYEQQVAASIMTECCIASGEGNEPTIKRETLTETFRGVNAGSICLSRRHNVSVSSVTVDGSAISSDDYMVNSESGVLTRILSSSTYWWDADTVTVVYQAGFNVAPPALKMAAMEMLKTTWATKNTTTAEGVKRQITRVDDIEEVTTEYFDSSSGSTSSSSSSSAVPEAIAGRLDRFRNHAIG